ncbi:hypothetical protein BD779DRAFT_1676673 [Infundibulicybe gibba]|nr:hypothetical protein BD779DRAFT_1615139 [Infundibulicybe gibba]KAF8878853.1 hypothetical protein BD779DRAFT_1676673 [Infundibulicybe gibba]
MNKKAAKTPKEVLCYEIRDVVLGKVRGYPPWPGMVVDPETIPAVVAKERPGGKKTNFYCVQFFPTGDYAWLVGKDISKLQTHEIESYINEPYKKSGDLLAGYRIALDPTKWQSTRATVESSALEEEANAEIDQLETENEDGEPKKQSKTKKRKRESDAAPSAKSKPKQTRVKKEPAEGTKKKASLAKSKKNGAKSKAMIESEDDGDHEEAEGEDDEDAGPSKKASPPPLKKTKREKEDDGDDSKLTEDPEAVRVREWRHKLQKTFLSNKTPPKEEDMPALDNLFTTVEKYDKINIQYLQFSKIGKVMRHIAILPVERVPKNEQYNFRERAKALVDKWHQILNANKSGGSESGAANGAVAKSDVGDKEEAVTDGTAALDLNGTADASAPKPVSTTDADAPAEDAPAEDAPAEEAGDVSALADVTMSEA